MSSRLRRPRAVRPRRERSAQLLLESLENRLVLSNLQPTYREYHAPGTYPSWMTPSPLGILPFDFGSPTPVGYTPQQIRTAYGLNNITLGGKPGDGTGQTIAIVDAYDDPSFLDSTDPNFSSSDLAQFDQAFGLPDPPSFTKYNENGQTTNLPGTDPAGAGNLDGNWEIEEALDIEWAHAIAPGAAIDLVEAESTSNSDLFTAVSTAASLPGVSVVSMSWGLDEFSGEVSNDDVFTTPSGHQGVTFVAASGDSGSPGYYPAYSPNVVAAGGTTLPLDANGDYPGTGPNGEVGWSGSGGGTSQFEAEPAYQEGVQQTGHRTIPDVAWDADSNTGVAVFDSYNDTDGSGAWQQVGGTSVAAPSWAGLFAIANQGRVGAGGTTFNSSTDPIQTLTALYALPSNDFNDILYGNNGSGSIAGFNAGPGYDEVTGLGTPRAELLIPDLVAYGAASKLVVTAQPPESVIADDSFGVEVAAEDGYGYTDSAYDGTLTLSLASGPGGASLGGTLTVQADNGVAVFDGLTLSEAGTNYSFKISSSDLASATTSTFDVTPNLTPWAGTYYPVPTDASLRTAITDADSNGFSSNTIVLATGTYPLSNATLGQLLIENSSSMTSKTLSIVGEGASSSIIEPGIAGWEDRIFEIVGTTGANMTVVFQDLSIEGGSATNGGVLGGTAALGGGILVDGGTVSLTNVTLSNNQAAGAAGSNGSDGAVYVAGGNAGNGTDGEGGAIYLAAGMLTLSHDAITQNLAKGGAGGNGGAGGSGKNTKGSLAQTGALGGDGGRGGAAAGGGIYVAGGELIVADGTFAQNQAIGGAGGTGGTGGIGGLDKPGGAAGFGGAAGAGSGGALYLSKGSLTVIASVIQNNSAIGGAGGKGGSGGLGGGAVLTSGSIGSILGGSGFGIVHRGALPAVSRTFGAASTEVDGHGGLGGAGGDGAAGAGGGIYVAGGTLTLEGVVLAGNQAIGGEGGAGGEGGIGGLNPTAGGTLPAGEPGGTGGHGGDGGSGYAGGLYVGSGTVTVVSSTLSDNTATGGQGGSGGAGGPGYLAAVFGSGVGGTGTGIITGGSGSGGGSTTPGAGGGTGANSGGRGGDGGAGAAGRGGGLYISGGAVTLINDTVAGNTAQIGAAGALGPGGHAGTGKLTGGPGLAGIAGNAEGGGLYVSGGSLSVFNSTVADNFVDTGGNGTSGGLGGGLDITNGTALLTSTIVALNTSGSSTKSTDDDIAGAVVQSGSYNLIGTGGSGGLSSNHHNQVGVSGPGLGTLADNGGPTQTIALQNGSPAIAAGSNPENLSTDGRGYKVPVGTTWDIGAYQTSGVALSTPPTATLQATGVTSANAGSLDPYQFTITYNSDVDIVATSLAGALVQVNPPGSAAISATVVSTAPVGETDALGDAQGFIVTYQITPPNGAWTLADNGTYTVTVSGAPVIDVAGNSVAAGAAGTFSVQISTSTNKLVVTDQPSATLTAGTSFSMTVSVENSGGTVQTGFNGSVTIALADDPGGTLTGNVTTTASDGVALFSDLELDAAADGYTIEVTSTGMTGVTTNSFDVTAAAASQLLVTSQPSTSITAGNTFGLTVTAEDQYGNVATAFAGSVAIALKSDPGGGSLGGTGSMVPTDGVATFSDLEIEKAGIGYTIQATGTGLTAATTNSFDVTAAAASQLIVTAQPPSTITAGNTFGLTVTAEDQYGNIATAFAGSIAVALTSNPGGGSLGGTGSIVPTDGVATFSDLEIEKAGNGFTIQATGTGLTAATTNSFDVTAAAASQLIVTAQPPSTITAGDTFGLTVTAEDPFGNVATAFAGSVALTLKSDPDGGSLGGTGSMVPTNGVAAFSDLAIDKAGNGFTIQATGTGLTAATTDSFDVTAAAASQLIVTVQPPSTITAGNTFGLTVTAEDQYGNVATAFASSVAIALQSDPGGGSLGGTGSMVPTDGVATFSDLAIDKAANGFTVQATGTGLTAATTNPFDITAAAASQLFVTAQPPSTITAGDTFGLTVTAEDQYGNVATAFAGSVAIALKSDPGGGSLGGTGSIVPTDGVAAFSDLEIDKAGIGFTIQASSIGVTDATTNSFDVTPVAATKLVVTAEPATSFTAGSTFGLTVEVEDALGNVVTNFGSTVDITLRSNPGEGSIGGTTSLNLNSGFAVFSGLTLDAAANGYTIQATGTGLTSATTDSFDVTPAAASQLIVTAQPPSTVTAGDMFGLTITAEDRYGNIATAFAGSVGIALKTNPGGSTLGGTVTVNASAGVGVFSSLTLDTAAVGYTIEGAGAGLMGATTSSFDVTPAAASQLVVTQQPPSSVAAGSPFIVVVSAEDSYGNVVTTASGTVTVALAKKKAGVRLGGQHTVALSDGAATFSRLSINKTGKGYKLKATSSGFPFTLTNAFNVRAALDKQLRKR
jgi:hypothetical protein